MEYKCDRILFSHRREGNPAICKNMNDPGGYYTKWNMSETGQHGVALLTYVIQNSQVYTGRK